MSTTRFQVARKRFERLDGVVRASRIRDGRIGETHDSFDDLRIMIVSEKSADGPPREKIIGIAEELLEER